MEANWNKIDNEEMWWACVDEHWPTFLNMLADNFGVRHDATVSHYIQMELKVKKRQSYIGRAYNAQAGEEFNLLMPFVEFLAFLKQNRDMKSLWGIFQGMWEDAPDSISIHGYHGWSHFCDLCSEGMGIVYEKEHPDVHVG